MYTKTLVFFISHLPPVLVGVIRDLDSIAGSEGEKVKQTGLKIITHNYSLTFLCKINPIASSLGTPLKFNVWLVLVETVGLAITPF